MYFSQKSRYIIFAVGFLFGLLVVCGMILRRDDFSFGAKGEGQLKPWYGRVYFENREVVSTGEAVETFHRIRLIGSGQGNEVVRLEEWGEMKVENKKEKILRRQVMEPNRIYCKCNVSNAEDLGHYLGQIMEKEESEVVEVRNIQKNLFLVEFKSLQDKDLVKKVIQVSQQDKTFIQYAWPVYRLVYY